MLVCLVCINMLVCFVLGLVWNWYKIFDEFFFFIMLFLIQVMDRFVGPLIAHLKTMLNYRKFRKGTKTDIDEILRIEKAKIPTKIVYCLGLSYDHPGTFILTYIRSVNPHHEYIGLYPKGFKFRKRMFGDVDHLVAYFQKHIDDPRSSGPTIQSAAAMVPIRSFSSGDDWGGSNNDGDRGGSQFLDGDKTFGLGSRGGKLEMLSFYPHVICYQVSVYITISQIYTWFC